MSDQKVNCVKDTREAGLGHAILTSGAHRWLSCTPSARLEQSLMIAQGSCP